MGLAEKRAAEEIKQKWDGGWQKRIQGAVGFPVEIVCRFETIVKDGQGGYAVDSFEKVWVESAEQAFKEICRDQLGKDSVKGALKKIVIQNVDGVTNGDYWAKFENGVLTLDHQLANVDYVKDRVTGLVNVLSNAL